MPRSSQAVLLAALCLSALSARGQAQDDCVLDRCADKRPPVSTRYDRGGSDGYRGGGGYRGGSFRRGPGPRGASRPGDFDFYVLALSWSPGFCANGGADRARDQCRAGAGLGFTVHGLWPQYDHGFPSDCRGDTNPPRAALATTDGVYPNQGLARYEWRKHGTCSGLSPYAYFAAAKAARDTVDIPPSFRDPHAARHIAPIDVERAFVQANPRLRPGMVAAVCRDETLEEVRICFDKTLKNFRACPEVVRAGCHSREIDVPPVR